MNDIQGSALPIQKLLDRMFFDDIPVFSRSRFAAASDLARIALITKGISSLPGVPKQNTDANNHWMIYMDLDITAKDSGGYLPLITAHNPILFHFYSSELLGNDDLIASNNPSHETLLYLMNSLSHHQESSLDKKYLTPAGFDLWYEDISCDDCIGRFPMLWDSLVGDNSWKPEANSLFQNLWRNEFIKYTIHP
ncbi:hypothetical protein [Endozoicomonas sp. OPT23]|uniref:hypothetical protein n=1 Tax=Endozoicomonas sp. OPT23 TaxID=2072845 RepID=UPI00129AB39F|nr:hypothetical protein [Endozoicomonas sp. OPT23]